MKRRSPFKTAVLIAVAVVIGYIGYYAYIDIVYSYGGKLLRHVPCPYLFSDKGRAGMESAPIACNYRKTDTIYYFIYKSHDGTHYYVQVWEIPALRNMSPTGVKFNKRVSLSNVQLYPAERLNSDFRIIVKFGTFFKHLSCVDLGDESKLISTFDGLNYRGFYGEVHSMAFENGHGQILAMNVNKDKVMPTLVVLYRGHGEFYIISIKSYKPFGVDMLKILNLK